MLVEVFRRGRRRRWWVRLEGSRKVLEFSTEGNAVRFAQGISRCKEPFASDLLRMVAFGLRNGMPEEAVLRWFCCK
jgi:hypothetical protein